jgi:hypothetical protein
MTKDIRFMNRKMVIGGVLFCILILESLLLNLKSSYAQEFSTGINPPILQIEAETPSNVKAPITLQNLSTQPVTYSIFLRPFKPNSEKNGEPNYDPSLNSSYQDFFEHVSLQADSKTITELTLSPGESKDLTLRISLPEGFKSSDYYFTIVFLSDDTKTETGTSTAGSRGAVGTNVLLSVGSKSNPQGRISAFSAPKFVTHGPVPFTLEIANHNDYFISSKGNLVVKNMFNQPVGNLDFGPVNILANSNRLIGNNNNEENPVLYWNEKFPIGIYRAQVNVALSDQGPLLTKTITFVAFPIQAFAVIIILALMSSWLIRRARKKALADE